MRPGSAGVFQCLGPLRQHAIRNQVSRKVCKFGKNSPATPHPKGNVAAFFSVLETKSATKESYKIDMINMLIDVVNEKY